MRLGTADDRSSRSDERESENEASQQSQMTPARRAALDALERELRDLLKAHPR